MHHIQNTGSQITRIQRTGLSRLQIYLQIPLALGIADALLQLFHIVARSGNVMPAAHVQPLHLWQHIAKPFFHRLQRGFQRICVLLTQGMKMQAIQKPGQFSVHLPLPLRSCRPESAARRTGVVDPVTLLSGTLRIDTESHAFPRRFGGRSKLCQLSGRIEHDVIGIPKQLLHFILPIGGAEDMNLFAGHLLCAKAGLIQAAGLGTTQIRGEHGVKIVVGKRLLGQ